MADEKTLSDILRSTLTQLINLARIVGDERGVRGALAKGVLDLLAEDDPCGFEAPAVMNGGVVVPESWTTPHAYSPDEARALGRMLFRAADEAEGKTGG